MTLLAAWCDGHPLTHLDLTERAWAYGDGLFSTVAIVAGRALFEAYHWQRLQLGCQRLGLATTAFQDWQHQFAAFIEHYPHHTVKIIISRGVGGRGYLPDSQQAPRCYLLAWPPSAHESRWQQGIQSVSLQGQLGLNPRLAGLKHLNRLEQVLLRQELASTGCPEGVVCDLHGMVVEGVFSNLFWWHQGQLLTPQLHQAGVAGVMRAWLLNYQCQQGQPVQEVAWTLPQLVQQAEELFFCNSLYGIWPIRQLNDTIYAYYPRTQQLQQQLRQQLNYDF